MQLLKTGRMSISPCLSSFELGSFSTPLLHTLTSASAFAA